MSAEASDMSSDIRGICSQCRHPVHANQLRVSEEGNYMHKDCYDQRNEIMMRLREGGDTNVQSSSALDAGQNFEYRGLCGVCGHEVSDSGGETNTHQGEKAKALSPCLQVYTNQLRVGQEGKYFHKSCFDEISANTAEPQPAGDVRKDDEYFV
eukprot:753270-Hanusia_phi.AAC.2